MCGFPRPSIRPKARRWSLSTFRVLRIKYILDPTHRSLASVGGVGQPAEPNHLALDPARALEDHRCVEVAVGLYLGHKVAGTAAHPKVVRL